MDAVVTEIISKWDNDYVEFGSEKFTGFLSDLNLLRQKRDKLKPAYENNKELYNQINEAIRTLPKRVYFPRPVPKPKEEVPEVEYKPEQFMSERQKRIKALMEKEAIKKTQQNLFG